MRCWGAARGWRWVSLLLLPHSALESIQRVRAAQAPHWMSLQSEGVDMQASAGLPRYACDPYSPPEARPSAPPPGSPVCEPAAATPSPLLDELQPCPPPPIRTAVALTVPDAALFLPPGVLHQVGSVPREETEAWARWAGRPVAGGGGAWESQVWLTGVA